MTRRKDFKVMKEEMENT